MTHLILTIAEFATLVAVAVDRLTLEIYRDILCAIHLIDKTGERTTLYNVGYRARVPNNRLKARLAELLALAFVDADGSVTKRGYTYLKEFKEDAEPFQPSGGLVAPLMPSWIAGCSFCCVARKWHMGIGSRCVHGGAVFGWPTGSALLFSG